MRILGENLVLFRDDKNRPGLLGIHCSHRGTDLSYGRVEDGGLRCVYHGWLYDINGRCLEQPGEPGGGEHRDVIRHPAYPCEEKGGAIFTYMGPGKAPLLPNYEFLGVTADRRYVAKIYHECNYQQANEGNIDPVHLSYLHRFFEVPQNRYTGVRNTEDSHYSLVARDVAPTIDVELTDFGVRIYTTRKQPGDNVYLRVSYFILPNLSAFPGQTGGEGYSVNWHVPIDDTHHWKYYFQYKGDEPVNPNAVRSGRTPITPDYHPVPNKANRYLQDRESMKTWSFSGMGRIFNVQDTAIVEGSGSIVDRTQEFLGPSDRAIIAARRQL
ncbi:MAG: Rieske 2Fe-2S domain-containing protein, partial [Gammaproteobacteria bacterium]